MDMLFDVTVREDGACKMRLEFDRSGNFRLAAVAYGSIPYDVWGAAYESNVIGDGLWTKASFVNALIREFPTAVTCSPRVSSYPTQNLVRQHALVLLTPSEDCRLIGSSISIQWCSPLNRGGDEIWNGTIATADALFY